MDGLDTFNAFFFVIKNTEPPPLKFLLFFLPGINFIFMTIVFMEICDLFHQPTYYGLLVLVPGLNIALLWYLAYVELE